MIAGADEPATLSGFCQPMAIAMVSVLETSIQDWRESDGEQTHGEKKEEPVEGEGEREGERGGGEW
jgi:hypothetical protein